MRLLMETNIDVLCYHMKTCCGNTNWSWEFSWLFLFCSVCSMYEVPYTVAAYGPAALGVCGPQHVPRESPAARVRGR